MDIKAVTALIYLCKRCPRSLTRRLVVPGSGVPGATVALVGEQPGYAEDYKGSPFVGKPGHRLNDWLEIAGLSRGDMFMTHVLKCFKKGPFPADDAGGPVEKCLPFLISQIKAIKPLAIVVAGRHALQQLVFQGSNEIAHPFVTWAGRICRRRDLFGEARIGVIWPPAKIIREWSPVDEQRSIEVIKTLTEYVAARQAGEPAPLIDLHDIRPASSEPTYQQHMRLF